MNFIKTFKNIFSGNSAKAFVEEAAVSAPDDPSNTRPAVVADDKPFAQPEPPAMRRVIRLSEVSCNLFPPDDPDKVLIKAQPSTAGDQCLFMLNRALFPGHSWWFPNFESAAGSPVAEKLFSLDDVETVLVHEATVTVTQKDKSVFDWKPLGAEIGAALRELVEEGGPMVSQEIIDAMPDQAEIQQGIQKAINEEVNPGVAGHGGLITLQKVKGNTITIKMGGGCQGCSAADLTLKQGIHSSFRKFVPQVGAIFDETDHAAGMNPYF